LTTGAFDAPPRRTVVQPKAAPAWSLLPGDGNDDTQRMRAETGLFAAPAPARAVVGAAARATVRSQAVHEVDRQRIHDMRTARLRGRKTNSERFRAVFWAALAAACVFGWYRFSRG